ncbi:MAG: hypothetical protein Q9160_004763 [Pyrenula sp. 1 TL-2023]
MATSLVEPPASTPTQTRPCTKPDETSISYRGDGTKLHDIYNALTTCPNITSLDLDLTWTGCDEPTSDWYFAFREEDKFPKIRKLGISDYDLEGLERVGSQPWPLLGQAQEIIGKAFASFSRSASKPREPNLVHWMRAMDFAELEELSLGSGSELFYKRMKSELPNLQSLSMISHATRNSSIPDYQLEFLDTVPQLTSLSIHIGAPYEYASPPIENRTLFPLETILGKHGHTLLNLSLTQSESQLPHLRRPMLSVDNFTAIRTFCPSLNHLNIDIDRNGTWPNSTFNAITSIESLTSLTLNLEIGADLHRGHPGDYGWNPEGLSHGGPFREPRMSLDVAEGLFRDLCARKQGQELEKVEFIVGDYLAKPYTGPLYLPSWDEGRGRMFVCEGKYGQKAMETESSAGRGTEGQEGHCRMLGGVDPWPDPGDEVPQEAWVAKDEL